MFLGFTALAGFAPYGCGGGSNNNQAAQSPSAYNTYNPNAPQTAPNGYGTQPPPNGGVMTGAPPATGAMPPATGQPAATGAPTAAPTQGAQDAIVGALIAPLGAKYAPGMTAMGAPFTANMTEGQHASTMITMQAGTCYTVVGVSPPGVGVKSLNLSLLAPPFYTVSAGQSSGNTNESTIGAGKNPTCPIVPLPVQYKLDIFAKSGSGPVAVQVYSKPK